MTIKKTMLRALLTGAFLVLPLAAQSVTVPHTENFDGAPLGAAWTSASTGPGQIVVGTPPSSSPVSGNNALLFDGTMSAVAYTNTQTLKVDLAGSAGCILKYWVREVADEADAADGLFISDGNQTVLAQSHQALSATWVEITIDVGQFLAANGMTAGGIIDLIWSQADNYPIPTDGLCVDDISLSPLPVADTGQANQLTAALNVNDGLNLSNQVAAIGVNGPFFATGNVAVLDIEGPNSWPFALLFGPLNRANATFAGVGNLDIGMLGQGNYADILLIVDGANPTNFFDLFAFTDSTGHARFTFDLTGFTPGVLGTFQGLIYQPASPFFKLTAAFEYTIP